jgi:membrane protease YdiL (CAAX protease family)
MPTTTTSGTTTGGLRLPITAALIAIAVTTAMDFTGYFVFSALPLIGLFLIFWLIQRQSRDEIGLTLGSLRDYLLALSYPAFVLGVATLIAYFSGAISLEEANWDKASLNIAVGSTVGILMLILTEEGFFRGWLWGAFRRAGWGNRRTLLVTSLLFTTWHISAVTSGTDYGLPWTQIPIYLTNATLLGLIWGLMRLISGSIVVASVSHAVWNAWAYELFGFGTKTGELGITNTTLFGPEVGLLGLALNGMFFLWLYGRAKKSAML